MSLNGLVLLAVVVIGFAAKMIGKDARIWDLAVFIVLVVLLGMMYL